MPRLPSSRDEVSVVVGSVVVDPASATSFDVFVDDVSLRVLPLFGDGFESGDLGAWSSTAP